MSPDYVARWESLKHWAEYEREACLDDARRAREDTDHDHSSGEAQGLSRVLARMERLEQEQQG